MESAVTYLSMIPHSLCLIIIIIEIEVYEETKCTYIMYGACNLHVVVIMMNFQFYNMSRLVYCCLCSDMITQRDIYLSCTQVSNTHGDILKTPSIHFLCVDCGGFPIFR